MLNFAPFVEEIKRKGFDAAMVPPGTKVSYDVFVPPSEPAALIRILACPDDQIPYEISSHPLCLGLHLGGIIGWLPFEGKRTYKILCANGGTIIDPVKGSCFLFPELQAVIATKSWTAAVLFSLAKDASLDPGEQWVCGTEKFFKKYLCVNKLPQVITNVRGVKFIGE